jgi:hypothetical protein
MAEISDSLKQAMDQISLALPTEKTRNFLDIMEDAEELFPAEFQQALMLKLMDEWDSSRDKSAIKVSSEICLVKKEICVTLFGILSPDWAGLSNTCLGVINEMGWNICFLRGYSFLLKRQPIGIILIGIRTDQEDERQRMMDQMDIIITKLKEAAVGLRGKVYLLSEEMRKLELFGMVISEIERIYQGGNLEKIIGLDGEAVKYFAARSRDYIENRQMEDIARQIILNFTYIQKAQQSGNTIQLEIGNFKTKTEGVFTGVTVAGPARMLNLEDCLKTIELTVPNFRLKHNREFTTKDGISLYRIEFVDAEEHPLSDSEQKNLRNGFSTLVLNKRRDRAQWIETIGGFEQYARAIIPLLVREAQNTGKAQIYQSVGQTTDLFIDFKIIAVVPGGKDLRKNLVNQAVNRIAEAPGLHLLSLKPPAGYGQVQLFIIDLRANLAILENVENIYKTIRSQLVQVIGEFRDFDEGMRTMDTYKFKIIRQHFENVEKPLLRELYYSIEDFFRISASANEIIAQISIALDMLKAMGDSGPTPHVIGRQTGSLNASGRMIPRATLVSISYPHGKPFLKHILNVLEPFEVTLSRLERQGRDILICRVTQKDKALGDEAMNQLMRKIEKLESVVKKKDGKERK